MRIERALEQRTGQAPSAGDTETPLTGTWVNELGSTMQLTLAPGGSLTGTYQSAVGDTAPYPLRGTATATALVFTVSFTATGSIAAWAGHYDEAAGSIEVLWHLVTQPDPGGLWSATIAGFDSFAPA